MFLFRSPPLMLCSLLSSPQRRGRPDWLWSGVGFRLDDRVCREDRLTPFLKQQLILWLKTTPLTPPPPPPLLPDFPPLLLTLPILLFSPVCRYTSWCGRSFFSWTSPGLSSPGRSPACCPVQDELDEQVEPAGSREPIGPQRRRSWALHRRPRDVSHGV